jgi:hypothetical protein
MVRCGIPGRFSGRSTPLRDGVATSGKVTVAPSPHRIHRHTTIPGSMVQQSKSVRCMGPRFESSSTQCAAVAQSGRAPPCYGGIHRTVGSPVRIRVAACGETCRQVTALDLKSRAERLRSSTLRLTALAGFSSAGQGTALESRYPRGHGCSNHPPAVRVRVCGPTARRPLPERKIAVRFGPHPLRGSHVVKGGERKTRYVDIRDSTCLRIEQVRACSDRGLNRSHGMYVAMPEWSKGHGREPCG